MPRGGQNRKSVEQRRAEGNPGKRKLPDPVLAGGRGKPKAPRGMPAKTRRVFDDLASALGEAGFIDRADGPLLEAISSSIVRARDAGKDIAKRGVMVKIERGVAGEKVERLEPNPSIGVESAAWAEVYRLTDALGMSPRSRAQLAELGVSGRPAEKEIPAVAKLRSVG